MREGSLMGLIRKEDNFKNFRHSPFNRHFPLLVAIFVTVSITRFLVTETHRLNLAYDETCIDHFTSVDEFQKK